MLFRRLIFAAVALGALIGPVFGVSQQFTTVPIILAAEHFERFAAHQATHHADTHWAPSDGLERTAFTVIADVCVVVGFALLLLVAMSVAGAAGDAPMGAGVGVLWGLAAFAVVFLAPALGLAPEVPGTQAAPLVDRQLWWLVTALVAAASLALLVFAPGWKKLPALVLLPLPYLFGAPEISGPLFAGHSPAEIARLEELRQQFVWVTAATNLALWVALGAACGWTMKRWIWAQTRARAPSTTQ